MNAHTFRARVTIELSDMLTPPHTAIGTLKGAPLHGGSQRRGDQDASGARFARQSGLPNVAVLP